MKSEARKLAEAAGLSRAWTWRALQVAAIPEDEFNRLVESDNPPTVSELVRLGYGKPALRKPSHCPHCGYELP